MKHWLHNNGNTQPSGWSLHINFNVGLCTSEGVSEWMGMLHEFNLLIVICIALQVLDDYLYIKKYKKECQLCVSFYF